MVNILQLMPYLEGDEMIFVGEMIKGFDESQTQQFAASYSSRRKDPTTLMILTLLGLLGIAGVQRFIIGQIGMGILYFFTAGLCFIGTIIDLVNYRKLAFEYNTNEARQVANLVRNFTQPKESNE